jgi:DNA helicase II / ATP-dependent DNA helicase PcrA
MTLTIVGDNDQTLYAWNGARPELMMAEIDKYIPDIETIILDKNYRSTEEIILSCQQLISHNYGDGKYNPDFMKDVSGVRGDGEPISFQMYPTVEAEALAVAETIQEMVANGHSEGDFFIGARTRAQLGYFEGPLVRKGIKFINLAGGSFWQSKHIADVVAYLRLAHNTSDSEALQQVYNIPSAGHCYTWNDKKGKFKVGDYCPTRYLGKEFLAKINNDFSKIDNVLFGRDGWRYQTKERDYFKHGPTKAQDLQEFVWGLQSVINQADNVGQVIRVIIDDCYEKYLSVTEGFTASDESENGKLEDLRTVEDIASEYTDIEKFLRFVDESIRMAEDTKDGNWDNYVVLSTYHRLKGLERPVVFGTGWCEGYTTTKDGREELRGLLPHTFSLVDPPQFGVLPSGAKSPIEDERCVAFVCISRAKDRVFLSGCERYREWKLGPSRFIQEVGIER